MLITVTVNTRLWCAVIVLGTALVVVDSLNGDHVCMVQQKYNITKRVKYRAPMSVRTYEWCFSMPPRCSKWKTEMRELTKLETDERIAEVAVCCPGYKMKDVSCVPICPNGRTGHRCSEDCPDNRWGPNCVHECGPCKGGICSPITGECSCQDGWQGESCEIRMLPTSSTTAEDLLTKSVTKPSPPITSTLPSTRASVVTTLETTPTTLIEITTRPSNLKSVIETPVSLSNRTSEQATVLSKIPLLKSTSTTTDVSVLKTTSTRLTKKPTVVVNPITSVTMPMTTPMTTPISKIVTTEVTPILPAKVLNSTATMLNITTTTEITTKNPTKFRIQSNNVLQSIKSSTVTSITEDKTKVNKIDKMSPTTTTELPETKQIFTVHVSTESSRVLNKMTTIVLKEKEQNQTEKINMPKTMHDLKVPVKVALDKIETSRTSALPKSFHNVTDISHTTIALTTERPTKTETAKRPQSTIRYFPTTIKFKPKEIWIRPAQKGEPYKSKTELNQDLHYKPKPTQPNTTPKTIIVSIIPTSVSYATFKKIALSTTSLLSLKTNPPGGIPNMTNDQEVTKPMTTTTESSRTTLSNVKIIQKLFTSKLIKSVNSNTPIPKLDQTTKNYSTSHTTREFPEQNVSQNGTNSMTSIRNLNSSNSLTTSSTNAAQIQNITQVPTTMPSVTKTERVTRPIKIVTVKPRNVTIITVSGKNKNENVVKITKTIAKDVEKTNATFKNTNQVTTESVDDEEFHILTEPEHITAVMEGKGKERSSVDLISVISIAGGIMMAVITVAVVIVMVERCKRPRYDDGRKVSDIRMQVMIDNNDVPPPYVRSIFHTPLPDPPTSEKCHYQPISTLDRNLKQFMRPVVVQSISPIMLENFREILECHYDHLPRRSHHYDVKHCSVAPSVEDADELTRLRPYNTVDSTIEALKCEARQDVLDSTTSEPLYAEIPCWRPPSEHAVEILNLNGEAVTEL